MWTSEKSLNDISTTLNFHFIQDEHDSFLGIPTESNYLCQNLIVII